MMKGPKSKWSLFYHVSIETRGAAELKFKSYINFGGHIEFAMTSVCQQSGCILPGTKVCGKCKVARYCGVNHQQLCWPAHKSECGGRSAARAKMQLSAAATQNETKEAVQGSEKLHVHAPKTKFSTEAERVVHVVAQVSSFSPDKWNFSLANLRDQGVPVVVEALKIRPCRALDLSCNSLTAEGAHRLLQGVLEAERPLLSLDLSANSIGQSKEEKASKFCVTLGAFLKTPLCALQALDLHSAGIDSMGVIEIAEGLSHNSTLTTLSLRANYITDNGIPALSRALQINKTLTEINLYCNDITEKGVSEINNALKSHPSLKNFGKPAGSLEDSCPVS